MQRRKIMKKAAIIVVAVLAIVLSVVCLTGCVGEVEGTYKFYSMTTDGVTLKVGQTYMGLIQLSEDFMTVELKKDGSCTFTVAILDETAKATWDKDGDKISITSNDTLETMEFTINGDELVGKIDADTKVVLKKSK